MLDGHGGNIYETARRFGCSPKEIVDMSSNINPLGPPPGLLDHLQSNMSISTRLPEVDSGETVKRFAEYLDIDSDRIGILGLSQGGKFAPVVSLRYGGVDFIVSVAAPLTKIRETIIHMGGHEFR